MNALIAGLVLGCSVARMVPDENLAWPQFRGPGGTGIGHGQEPPVELGPNKNVKWKVAVPSGLSSPVVVADMLVITAFADGKLYTIAYNRADGTEAWRADARAKEIEPFHKKVGSPAASTPATDGTRIVSYFGSCGLVCYDLTGKELWRFELPRARTSGDFGSGVSPILAHGVVILVRDELKGSKIIAVDVSNGSLKWEQDRQSTASYSTPVVWDTPAGRQVVVAGHARMIGYDLMTGDEKWSIKGLPAGCCPSPVVVGSTLFFAGWSPGGADDPDFQIPSFDSLLKDLDKDQDGALSRAEAEKTFEGFFDNQDTNKDGKVSRDEWDSILKFIAEGENSAFALKPGAAEAAEPQMLWKKTKGLPYISSAIAYGGQYVMVKDGGIVTSYDMESGKEIYQQRALATGSYYASPVAANGHIYFTSMEDGAITVVNAEADKPEVVSKNPALGERTAATPAIADNTLYVRTEQHLYAFAETR